MNETLVELVVWIIIGMLAGSLTGLAVKRNKKGFGWYINLGIGMAGALIGGFLFDLLNIDLGLANISVSVQDIVDNVGTSQSNISQHLAILRDKGILASRKDANRVFYRVGDARTLRLIGMMQDVFCSY